MRLKKLNKQEKARSLAFFMTFGMTLNEWSRIGMFDREIEIINKFSKYFDYVYIFTYGNKVELNYQKKFNSNVKIIFKKNNLSNLIYSIFLPFLYLDIIKKCQIARSNQIKGAHCVILSKIVNKKLKSVVRCGYSLSFTLRKKKEIFFSFPVYNI